MNHSEEIGALAAAKAKAQAKFTPIGKDRTADVFSKRTGQTFSYSYADLASVLEAVTPALSEFDLALFQPPRVDGTDVVVTTLLVHGESGQWISEEYRLPIADPSDPRSVGSATTYARRYAATGLLGIASSEEDDDGEQARGGQHEMAPPQGSKACPVCGVVGSLIKSKFGGYVCWKSKGGCETKWPEGAWPTSAPVEQDMTPKQIVKPPVSEEGKPTEAPPLVASPGAGSNKKPKQRVVASATRPMSRQEAEQEAMALRDEAAGGEMDSGSQTDHEVQDAIADAAVPDLLTFKIGNSYYQTKGITENQMRNSFDLAVRADKKIRKGYSRELLGKMLGLDPYGEFQGKLREQATEAQAAEWLKKLEQAIEEGKA